VEEAERGIAQQRHDHRALPDMNQAGILSEIDVFVPMPAVFNGPMPAPQGE
jgi:hypothetical protein